MKKILFFASALAGLLLAGSCQREELAPAAEGSVVTFEVSVPEIATKANVVVDDGTNINDLVYAVYRTSATSLENAQKDENPQLIYQKNYETNPFKGNQAVVPIELINDQNYLIVFWAQVNDAWVKGNSFNLMRIGYPTEMYANDSDLAAFTNVSFISKDDIKGGAIKKALELTRPFAQIRIGTTLPKNVIQDVVLTKSSVTVTGAAEAFNVLKQAEIAGEPTDEVEFKLAEVPTDYIKVNNVDYKYAAMNYIFAKGNVGVAYNIETAQHGTVTTEAIPDVPVQRNYRTNIVGNLLTSEAKYTVTLDQDWGPEGSVDNDYVVNVASSAQDIKEALESIPDGGSGEIKLGGDIDLGELFAASTQAVTKAGNAPLPIVVLKEKSITLDLNGFTITTPWEDETAGKHYYAFDNKGTLKIVDSKTTGKIVARGIFNYGKMTLESGTIEACDGNGGYGVRNYEGAEFVMNGGTVATIYEDGDIPGEGYDASPIRVDQGAKAEIKGGIINNVSNFTVAIDNYGETIVDDGTFTSVHTTLANSAVMTINGGSFTCNGLEGVTAHALWAAAGTTTINGGTFNGKDNYNGFNVCASKGAVVNITGGKFLPVHSGSLYGEGTINVTGGTFFDNPSARLAVGYEVKEINGTYVVSKMPDVAKIGETGYWSLNAAVAAVQDGQTITLVADEAFTETNRTHNSGTWYDGLYYVGDKSFTIDLCKKTISQDGAVNDYLLNFKNDGTKENVITLKNGTINAGTTAYCALATASSNAQKMTINLENINLINNNSNGAVVKFRGGAELNVNAGTVITGTDSYVGIEAVGNNTVVNVYEGAEIYQNGTTSYVGAIIGASYNATLNIYGGEGKSAKCGIIVMSTGATINVSGGEWTANDDGTVAAGNNGVLVSQNNRYESGWACKSVLNVTGGTFKGGYDCWGMGPGQEPDDAQINIKGGNFNANPANYVVAGYEATENAGTYTVAKPAALQALEAALAKGGNVTLTKDVTLLESIKVENKVVLDLNGKTITAPLFSAFEVKAGGELTVKNGKVVAYESTVRAIGGKVIIESGEYTSTGTAADSPATYRYSLDCREDGELIINGGTFKSNNGMINVGSTVTINGGKFENIVEKTKTRHFAYVSAPLTINDGEFYGKANSSAGGCFFCGAGAGGDIQVIGGKFTSLWTSGSVNKIFESYFGGTITVSGGMFNTNGGIATFVTENTDEATKAAYPYVAK